MTANKCVKRIEYFIQEAKYLRGHVIGLDFIDFDKPIVDERLEPFWNDLFEFIKSITDNEDYINLYISDKGGYEYNVGKSQKRLMELKETIQLYSILNLK